MIDMNEMLCDVVQNLDLHHVKIKNEDLNFENN